MQDKDALDTFSAAFVFFLLRAQCPFCDNALWGNNRVNKQKSFSLAHDTLPYISMQTDHDLINLIMT